MSDGIQKGKGWGISSRNPTSYMVNSKRTIVKKTACKNTSGRLQYKLVDRIFWLKMKIIENARYLGICILFFCK